MTEHLVLIPGLLCTGDLFAPQTRNLSPRITTSVADTLSDATLGEMAERLLQEAPVRFSLAGLSMGGYVAFEVLERAPERVDRLILLDTSARADLPEQLAARRALVAKAQEEGIAVAVEELIPRLLGSRNQSDPDLLALLHAMAKTVGTDGFARQQEAIIARLDRREWLKSLHVPTLVIVGEDDILTPPKVAREMVEALPEARLEEVAGAGHLSTLEQPEAVTRLLQDFLAPA